MTGPTHRRTLAMAASAMLLMSAVAMAEDEPSNFRTPKSEAELHYWLDNMVRLHGFSVDEVHAATGLEKSTIQKHLADLRIRQDAFPKKRDNLLVVPFPGGRHPRIGFLEGAIRPQRETKISVFTPWAKHDYVVVDVPEAIWSNLGLTYLAHTHIPTVFDEAGQTLAKLEWNRHDNGSFDIERTLPNGIRFTSFVWPRKDHVRMELRLTNGTKKRLTGLRVQNCVMLKSAAGFNAQTNENKITREPYAACQSEDGKRWIITGWDPLNRAWFNDRCPCLHSDPVFPNCDPGKTVRVRGWLSFYEGDDIDAEIKRIESVGWQQPAGF